MEIEVERTIPRPVDDVAPYFFDAANNPEWQSGMKSCEWVTDGPIAVGSRYRQQAEFRGKPVISLFEVTEFEEGRRMRIESIESTFPIQVTRTVVPDGETQCRVAAHVTGEPGGVLRLLSFLGERLARRSIEADYDRLVEHFRASATD